MLSFDFQMKLHRRYLKNNLGIFLGSRRKNLRALKLRKDRHFCKKFSTSRFDLDALSGQ